MNELQLIKTFTLIDDFLQQIFTKMEEDVDRKADFRKERQFEDK